MGILPLNGWADEGTAYGNADSMYLASDGYVWLGIGSQVIITNTIFNTVYQTINFAGGATVRVNCFYQYSGYMFIGGIFDSVNGNATAQYGITRINISGGVGSYTEDPIYESSIGIYGVSSGQEVYAIQEAGGNLWVGGNFTNFNNGNTANYGFRLQNPTGSSGSQTYDTLSGALDFNNIVNTIALYGSYLFWGGLFTNIAGNSRNYISAYDVAGNAWNDVASNNFSGAIGSIIVSQTGGGLLLVGGSYSVGSFTNLCYVDGAVPNNPPTDPNLSPSVINRGGLYGISGVDLIACVSGDNYRSNGFATWIHLGQSNAGIAPSGCFWYNNEAYNSYNSYSYVRKTFTQSQTIVYGGFSPNTFLYNGANYQYFTMSSRYTAQSFIANANGSYWIPLGVICQGGSFS